MDSFDGLRARITANMAAFERLPGAGEGLKAAAVAIAVTSDQAGRPAFFLTRRAPRLNAHSGQWALPGGRLDPGEDAITAALREMDEEIGVRVEPDHVLGVLDDYVTRSGYCMTPVVVWAGPDVEAVANPSEVAQIFRIPLADTLEDRFVEMLPVAGSEHPMVRINVVDRHMHAPTAAVVYQFREVCLAGRMTRAAHLLAPGWTAR
jgi:8-oxo-dGTP pyrophosphatase MutT (NUDIX family)